MDQTAVELLRCNIRWVTKRDHWFTLRVVALPWRLNRACAYKPTRRDGSIYRIQQRTACFSVVGVRPHVEMDLAELTKRRKMTSSSATSVPCIRKCRTCCFGSCVRCKEVATGFHALYNTLYLRTVVMPKRTWVCTVNCKLFNIWATSGLWFFS